MLASSIPTKVSIPFASSAGGGYTRAIPNTSQIGVTPGAASFPDGFPPVTFLPVGSGGTPPWGQDFNGLLNQMTKWTQWQGAGGLAVYDAAFSTAIGGYPQGALLAATAAGGAWLCIVDNNTTNPDAGGAGWVGMGPALAYAFGQFGQCQLSFNSATQLILRPFGGNRIQANGVSNVIPPGGVTAANTGVRVNGTAGQNLAASTSYYVYLLNVSGTLTFDFWTGANSGHITDTTAGNIGVEVRNNAGTPDSTRTLIGWCQTTAGGQFLVDGGNILVSSWYNKRPLSGSSPTPLNGATTASTALIELSSGARVNFFSWASESTTMFLVGFASNSVAGDGFQAALGLDSTTVPGGSASVGTSGATNQRQPVVAFTLGTNAEGVHFVTILGDAQAGGTASFTCGLNVSVRG